jgi:hypothetical protein
MAVNRGGGGLPLCFASGECNWRARGELSTARGGFVI